MTLKKVVNDAEFVDQSVEYPEPKQQAAWVANLTLAGASILPPGKYVPKGSFDAFGVFASTRRRSSLVFRFQKANASLDIRAHQDIVRLRDYLNQQRVAPEKVFVVGFADAEGYWSVNQQLSRDRAAGVAAELSRLGVKVPKSNIVGFSYLAPVACGQDGKDISDAKNRRVEVWVMN